MGGFKASPLSSLFSSAAAVAKLAARVSDPNAESIFAACVWLMLSPCLKETCFYISTSYSHDRKEGSWNVSGHSFSETQYVLDKCGWYCGGSGGQMTIARICTIVYSQPAAFPLQMTA